MSSYATKGVRILLVGDGKNTHFIIYCYLYLFIKFIYSFILSFNRLLSTRVLTLLPFETTTKETDVSKPKVYLCGLVFISFNYILYEC